jgi:hypothetical protein
MGTSPFPLSGLESESPLRHLDDEALIRRYCTALATATTDEEAAQELWRRHRPILLQKIKYIAAKSGEIRPDVIDFGPFVEASLGWAWQKYFGGIRGLKNPGSMPALLAWLERVAFTSCITERRKILTRGPQPVPLDEVVGQEDVPKREYEAEEERGSRYKLRPGLADRQPPADINPDEVLLRPSPVVAKKTASRDVFSARSCESSHVRRGTDMWMRSCPVCKALLCKLRLHDSVRCQCGWTW